MTINIILNKFKNKKDNKLTYHKYSVLKIENKKSNQTCFQNYNFLKIKIVFKK